MQEPNGDDLHRIIKLLIKLMLHGRPLDRRDHDVWDRAIEQAEDAISDPTALAAGCEPQRPSVG
jgi:hypothetical protein